jgi:hypothetical protein
MTVCSTWLMYQPLVFFIGLDSKVVTIGSQKEMDFVFDLTSESQFSTGIWLGLEKNQLSGK